jgi:hypothetical protein
MTETAIDRVQNTPGGAGGFGAEIKGFVAAAESLVGSTDTAGAAAFLGLGVSTLERMRCRGGGPIFNKLTDGPNGRVTYDYSDLVAYKASRKQRSTSGTSPLKGQRRKSDDPAPPHASL